MQFKLFRSSRRKRTLLSRVAPSWVSTPVRRIVQAGCLIVFVVLFAWFAKPTNFAANSFVELFLAIDPLVSVSAAIAAKAWVWSLAFAGAILVVSLLAPRFFCGYLCPLGTTIDLFDFAISRPVRKLLRLSPSPAGGGLGRGGFLGSLLPHLRFLILAAVLVAAIGGIMLAGFFAAIPIITRAFAFVFFAGQPRPAWASPIEPGQIVSLAMFAAVLGLGLLGPRFWCRRLCPTGALFSAAGLLRLTGRRVSDVCTRCGLCGRVCDFAAINSDASTASHNCTFCQTCGAACPVGAISFSHRFAERDARAFGTAAKQGAADLSRRGFLLGLAGGATAGGLAAAGIGIARSSSPMLRPPGAAADPRFSQLCVRCGQCLRVCPTGVLVPAGIGEGLDRLWTPTLDADRAGCDYDCNRCGQVCPTGAIADVTLDRKRLAVIGLAEVNEKTCLQFGSGGCETVGGDGQPSLVCADACAYNAIVVSPDSPAPVVLTDVCVGCGKCQAACYAGNVRLKHVLSEAAVRVAAIGRGRGRLGSPGGSQEQPNQQVKPDPQDVPYDPAAGDDPPTTTPASSPDSPNVDYFIPD